MLLAVLTSLAIGITGVLIAAHVVRFVAASFLAPNKAAIAAFAFVLGAIAASQGISAATPAPAIALHMGAVLGIALVWVLFFKRSAASA